MRMQDDILDEPATKVGFRTYFTILFRRTLVVRDARLRNRNGTIVLGTTLDKLYADKVAGRDEELTLHNGIELDCVWVVPRLCHGDCESDCSVTGMGDQARTAAARQRTRGGYPRACACQSV